MDLIRSITRHRPLPDHDSAPRSIEDDVRAVLLLGASGFRGPESLNSTFGLGDASSGLLLFFFFFGGGGGGGGWGLGLTVWP